MLFQFLRQKLTQNLVQNRAHFLNQAAKASHVSLYGTSLYYLLLRPMF